MDRVLAYYKQAYYIGGVNPQKPKSLGFLIIDAARLLRRQFDQETRHLDMTSAQLQILGRLAHAEGINQAQLAGMLDMEPITVSRHVDRMEKAGFVERRPDPQDRRVWLLSLTEKGKALLPGMREIAQRIFAQAQEGLSESERATFMKGLEQLVSNLSRKPAELAYNDSKRVKVLS
jgi:DNA-binding MarR family transcriptional regulator